jgi:hypothetical protein
VTAYQRVSIGAIDATVPILVGDERIRVSGSAKYTVDYPEEIEFSLDNASLAMLTEITPNSCTVQANSSNKLGNITLTARSGSMEIKKVIKIVSLW